MANSSKMLWNFPDQDENPWYDSFESMVIGQDSSAYASREDRSIVLSGGGLVSFVASTGIVEWSAAIVLLSPIAGYQMSLPAGSATLLDGECLYVNVTRSPVGNVSLSSFVAGQVPNTDSAMLLAIRSGSIVYWRNGAGIADGDEKSLIAGAVGPTLNESVKLATRDSNNSETNLVVGADSFNPLDYANGGYTRVILFRAVAANGDVDMTTSVSLYNVTDADPIATLSFTSTTPTKNEIVLVEGSGSGKIDQSEKIYEVRISLTSPPGGPTNTIELYGAEILVVNTAV